MGKFFKTLDDAEIYGLNMGNRYGGRNRKSKESPQGLTFPWMTKWTKGKGFWVKITSGKHEGKAYPVKKGDKRVDYYGRKK